MVSAYNRKWRCVSEVAGTPNSAQNDRVSREYSNPRSPQQTTVGGPAPAPFSFRGERKFVVIALVNQRGPVSPLALGWYFGGESLSRQASGQGRNAEK
jgi:hypothetical protein